MNCTLVVLIAFAVLMGGCSAIPEQQIGVFSLRERQYLQQLNNWSFEGRLALIHENESMNMSVIWRHQPGLDFVELSGPLGQGGIKISAYPDRVVVDDGDIQNVYFGDAEQNIIEQFGVEIPIWSMKFWVLGVNDTDQLFSEVVNGFQQGDWLVRYLEMQSIEVQNHSNQYLPKKMTAEKNKTKLKLIVDQWDITWVN